METLYFLFLHFEQLSPYARALQTGGRDPLVGRKEAQWGLRDFKF